MILTHRNRSCLHTEWACSGCCCCPLEGWKVVDMQNLKRGGGGR